MTKKEKSDTLKWIQCWQNAGLFLEQERIKNIRNANTKRFVRLCSGIYEATVKNLKERHTSGLVEQQDYFRKLNRHL